MISGKTKLVAIFGYPVSHSLSPAMQNVVFKQADLDCVYVPLPVEPEKLSDAIKGFRAMGFIGANVTVPHKESIMQYLDDIDETAKKIGAVNTIVVKNDKLIGYNTDVGGFSAALFRHHFDPLGKKVIIFGAGGAAKAIVHSLIDAGCSSIVMGARDALKAKEFAENFEDLVDIASCGWDTTEFRRAHWDVDLLVNTTPVGMEGVKDKALPAHWTDVPTTAFAADIVYNPTLTTFLRQARLRGCRGMNGLAMLVEQGALSFELWFGIQPHREIMYETVLQKSPQ